MNTYNLSEKEQVELVKNWFKKYGVSLLAGVLIAIIGNYGWRYWQERQAQRNDLASVIYEQMLTSDVNRQPDQFNATAAALMQNYPKSPYASLAGLMVADHAVMQNNLATAEKQLQWVVQNAPDRGLKQIAILRTARVLIAENQPQAALTLLQNVDKNFASAAEIVKGDAYVALNDKSNARIAYQNALNTLPQTAIIRQLVQMKLDELS